MNPIATLHIYGFEANAFPGLERIPCEAICWWTNSKYAHIGLSLGHWYFEAEPVKGVTGSHVLPEGAKLVFKTRVRAPLVEPWLGRQVGKPYDWPGIFGFVWRDSENGRCQRGKWFCSELALVALRRAGVKVLGNKPAWRVSPGMLVNALEEL